MFSIPGEYKETPLDTQLTARLRETPIGEYLSAKIKEGWDWTAISHLRREKLLQDTERLADAPERIRNLVALPEMEQKIEEFDGEATQPLSKEEWENSEWYREDIEYQEKMNKLRASALAESYDSRRYRESLVERSPAGLRSALGFGAMMATQALDPVNYVPIFGMATKAKMVSKFGTIGGRAALSSGEAVVGTALTEPFLLSELKKQGEDVGWLDGALDLVFAAGIGGAFGTIGGVRQKRKALDMARRRLNTGDRQTLGLAGEKAIADLSADQPVDVQGVFESRKMVGWPDWSGEGLDPESMLRGPEWDGGPVRQEMNFKVEPQDAPPPEIAEAQRTMLAEETFDPKVWDVTPEDMMMIEDLKQTGLLPEEDIRMLAEADAAASRSDMVERAYNAAYDCVVRT